jgi:class 3 adenylate cyclase
MTDIRVLIADDHPVVRGGLKSFLGSRKGIRVIGEAGDGEEAVARAVETRPDVVLMDLEMPRLGGIETARALRRRVPGAKILVLSGYADEPRVCGVLEAGVEGYLTTDVAPEALADAIIAVSRCEPAFCPAVLHKLARQATADARPRGTVTIVFTDIEDSTRVVEERGDLDARVLFRKHDALVRDAVSAHRGCIVEHPGDAFMLAFSSAVSAVQCAAALQHALARAARDRPKDALRVRIGLNTGDVLCEGDGYFGRTVFLAARIAEAARGGEVLVSEVTVALLAGRDFALEFQGTQPLKGLQGAQALYRLNWQDVGDGSDA